MTGRYKIGRIFGINIKIDWSWLFIFFLISWNLTWVFGNWHPDWGLPLQVGVAIIAALLFFLSVLAHELAHSIMAVAQNVPVRSITLHMFGGVSNIERHPHSPLAEFLITVVGPITSFIIGGIFVWLSGVQFINLMPLTENPSEVISQLGPLGTIVLWLGPINLLLGFFNLIPGFPLDGGRILRSILWAFTDNLRRATRWASTVGQGIAWLMIASGISMVFGVQIPFFGTGVVNGLWLAFIGWFLNSASIQSYRQMVIQDILDDVPVSQVMRNSPEMVSANITVENLVHDIMMRSDERAFPVFEDREFVGLVTLDDVRRIPKEKWPTTAVAEMMTPVENLTVVKAQDDADQAFNKLIRQNVRQLPVMDRGKLVGLFRRRDIIRWLSLQTDSGLA